jgi:hypothetical protein
VLKILVVKSIVMLEAIDAVVFVVVVGIFGGDDYSYSTCIQRVTEGRTCQWPSYITKLSSPVFVLPSNLTLRC